MKKDIVCASQAILNRLTYLLTSFDNYTKMKTEMGMEKIQKKEGALHPRAIKKSQISEEKTNDEEAKTQRCNPCMHCGVHCIFLKDK